VIRAQSHTQEVLCDIIELGVLKNFHNYFHPDCFETNGSLRKLANTGLVSAAPQICCSSALTGSKAFFHIAVMYRAEAYFPATPHMSKGTENSNRKTNETHRRNNNNNSGSI
jgi:hypothetical protein